MLDKLISSFDTEHHVWTEEVAQDVEDEHDLVISGFRKDSAFRGYIWISETSGVYMKSTSCTHGLTDGKRGIVSGVRFHSYHGEPGRDISVIGGGEGLLIEQDEPGRIVFCGMQQDGLRHGPGTEYYYDRSDRIPCFSGQIWVMGALAAVIVGSKVIPLDAPADLQDAQALIGALETGAALSLPKRACALFEAAFALRERFGLETDPERLTLLRELAEETPKARIEREYRALADELEQCIAAEDAVGADAAAQRIIRMLAPVHDPRAPEAADRLAALNRRLFAETGKTGHPDVYETEMRSAALHEEYGDAAAVRACCERAIAHCEAIFVPNCQTGTRAAHGRRVLAAKRLRAQYAANADRRAEIADAVQLCEALVRFSRLHKNLDRTDAEQQLWALYTELAGLCESDGDTAQADMLRGLVQSQSLRPAPALQKPDFSALLTTFREEEGEDCGFRVTTAGFFPEGRAWGLTLRRKHTARRHPPGYDRSYVYHDPALLYADCGIRSDSCFPDTASRIQANEAASVKLLELGRDNCVRFCGMHFDGKRHGLGAEFRYDKKGNVTKELCGLWQNGVLTHIYADGGLKPL